jgi:hypothetical protein
VVWCESGVNGVADDIRDNITTVHGGLDRYLALSTAKQWQMLAV